MSEYINVVIPAWATLKIKLFIVKVKSFSCPRREGKYGEQRYGSTYSEPPH